MPSEQHAQAADGVTLGGDSLGNRPNPFEEQGIDDQAAEGGQDLDAVVFRVAVGVFPQRHVPHPVPAFRDGPALPDGHKQGVGSSAQTRHVVTGFILLLACADAMAA